MNPKNPTGSSALDVGEESSAPPLTSADEMSMVAPELVVVVVAAE